MTGYGSRIYLSISGYCRLLICRLQLMTIYRYSLQNNVSSARSRAKKAELLKEMKAEAGQLEKKNIELKVR